MVRARCEIPWCEEVMGQRSWGKNWFYVSFTKIGEWDVISYSMQVPENIPPNTNVRAHLVQADTWIELHLSTDASVSPNERYALLSEVVRSIQIQQKQ